MMRTIARTALLLAAGVLAACVPPRERLDGVSPDGSTFLALDLRPTAGDSVRGAGVLKVAGRPRPVVLQGRWNERGDGLRKLEATVRADAAPGERWALEWSPSSLVGSLRAADSDATIALGAP